MKAAEFDKRFEAGEDITAHVDWSRSRRPNCEARRIEVDFPAWVVTELDRQARRLGVDRQALIRMWIADRLQV